MCLILVYIRQIDDFIYADSINIGRLLLLLLLANGTLCVRIECVKQCLSMLFSVYRFIECITYINLSIGNLAVPRLAILANIILCTAAESRANNEKL